MSMTSIGNESMNVLPSDGLLSTVKFLPGILLVPCLVQDLFPRQTFDYPLPLLEKSFENSF